MCLSVVNISRRAGFILALTLPLALLADHADYSAGQLISHCNLEVAETPVSEHLKRCAAGERMLAVVDPDRGY